MASAIQLARSSGRLQEWRTVARMCLAFYAGCRWSDATNLRLSHLKFDPEGVAVKIPKSKTDQLGRGETVFVQYAAHESCPVLLLQDYITKLRYGDRDGFLQPRIRTEHGVQSGIWNTTVSYTTALSDLKILLASLGLDASKFGEHSGRRGGATAASDAGVDWPDLMLHGRWKSMATPLGYLANSRRRQRRVASALAKPSTSLSSSSSSSSVHLVGRRVTSRSPVPAPSTPPLTPRIVQAPAQTPTPQQNPPPEPPTLPAVLPAATSTAISAAIPVPPPPVRQFAFQPLSNADWIQAKRRYTGASLDQPIPDPPYRVSSELIEASEIAAMLESPTNSPTVSATSSTMDAIFHDNDVFELMIL